MWIVQPPSPGSSTPATPLMTPTTTAPPFSGFPASPSLHAISPPSLNHGPLTGPQYNTHSSSAHSTISATAIPGATLSGRLSGVISLTDVLNLIAKASGLNPHDPGEAREMRRRRSSSTSLRSGDVGRKSVDSTRSESVGGSSSVAGSRRGSVSGGRRLPQ